MNQEYPYEVQEGVAQRENSLQSAPLFWTRILRFSIYFTVIGVTLGFIKYRLSLGLATGSEGDQTDAMNKSLDSMIASFTMIGGFLLFGITSIIICLFMRVKELKNRAES